MLIIISGPDRAGKSTLIKRCQKAWQLDQTVTSTKVIHSGPIPHTMGDMMAYHRNPILSWLKSGEQVCLLDRSYVCTHLLGFLRRQHTSHFDEMIDYEIWLQSLQIDVIHVGLTPPWHKVAKRHILELETENPTSAPWAIRDQFITRMNEHSNYIEELINFYERITMFPNITSNDPPTINPRHLLAACNKTIE